MSKQASRGLGKGFGSLLPQDFDQSILLDKHDRIQKVAIEKVTPDPDQPRRLFDSAAITELASSIKRYGILQPLVVIEKGDGFQIVAGERRYQAAKKAGLKTVPVIARSLKEIERLEISLVENVQRVDLNPIEQAVSIAKLHEQFNIEYDEIALRLGKARTTITNIVRLLQLPDFARDALVNGKISEGHARAILSLKHEPLQQELLNNIEQFGWSVRAAEQFASEFKELKKEKSNAKADKKPAIDQKVSKTLSTKWGFKFTVKPKDDGGSVAITFKDRQQLDDFLVFLDKSAND